MADLSIQEIKTIIRGLLISTPEEVTVLKLRHDFKAQEGQDIPFYRFGFHDLTSFLRSMPDVCKITNNGIGPYPFVRVVESNKSTHVSSLVLRQKTIIKGRRRRPSSRGKFSQQLFKPLTQKNYHPKELHQEPTSFEFTRNRCFKDPDIQSLPCEGTAANTIEHFESSQYDSCNALSESCTKDDNTELTGNKESAVLEENHLYMRDTSVNEFADLQTFFDFHLRQILVNDEGWHIKEIQEYLQNELSTYGIVIPNDVELILRRIPYICIEDDYVYNTMYETLSDQEKSVESMKGVKSEIYPNETDGGFANEDANSSENIFLSATASTFIPSSSSSSSEKIQRLEKHLISLMKDNIHGILGSELKEKYKMRFAEPLNFQALGFNTIEDLVAKMPHVFNYISLENGDCKLYSCTSVPEQKLEEPIPEFMGSYKESVVPFITQRNVQWMMTGFPNGLDLKDFEQTYKDTFLTNIELKQMNLSIEEFVKCLEEVDILKIHVVGSDTWVFPVANSGNILVNNEPLPVQEDVKNEIDFDILKAKFPLDVVGPDTHVKSVEIPKWMRKKSLIEIFVQEVKSPHNFWITFCGEQYTRALDSLMDDLQAFYCSKSHSYRMPSELIREGQDCVTQYLDEWHRARVTNIISATEIEVCFYDYGTKRIVPKNNIHYLHNAHSSLPAQAISAGLANLAPKGGKWTQEASKRFLQLIADKALIGIVVSVDYVNNVFSLFLCDTSEENTDVYIHEVLISEGYAVEVGLEKEETKLQNETSIVETLEQETKLVLEEEVQSCVTSGENGVEVEKGQRISTAYDNISQEDITPCSDVLDQSRNSSRKTSQSSLSYAVESKCLQPVSTPTAFDDVASMSTVCDSSITKNINERGGLLRKIAPPPGFSPISKCVAESSIGIESDSLVLSNKKELCDNVIEISETQTKNLSNNLKECDKESPPVTTFRKMDYHQPAKGVSSGVNANISQDLKYSYLQSSYTYPNWNSSSTTYSNYSTFPAPSFPPPVNALAPLPMNPFPISPMPNPVEYCNMWYYEQCRQQAFFQGMLAHQQMTNASFSPFSPGAFLPPSYTSLNSPLPPNQMNISEVHSPETSPAGNPNSRGSSPAFHLDSITAATQTEVPSVDGKGDKILEIFNAKSAESLPSENIAECIAADSSAKEYECSVYSGVQRENESPRCNEPVQIIEDTCDTHSPVTSVVTVCEEVAANDLAESSFHDSHILINGQNLNFGKSDLEVNLSIKGSENVNLNQPLSVFNETSVIFDSVFSNSTNLNDSQGIIEKDSVNNPLPPISDDDIQIKHDNRTSVETPYSEVQCQDENSGGEPCSSQNILCSAKAEENGMVLYSDLHHFEGVRKEKNVAVRISQLDVANHSIVKTGCEEFEEQELAQLLPIKLQTKQDDNLNEDDFHEQEIIKKNQPEFMKTSFENFENVRNSSALEVHAKLLSRENNDLTREMLDGKADNVFLNDVQSSVHKTLSLGSVDNYQCERNEDCGNGDGKSEIATEHLLRQENHLIELQSSNRHSSVHNDSCPDTFEKPSSPSEVLCSELGVLSISNQEKDFSHARLLVQQYSANQEELFMKSPNSEVKSEIKSKEKNKIPKSPAKRVRPVLGAKLSNEVSASFTSEPSQPAMTQKTRTSTPIGDSLLTKDSGSIITQPLSQSASWKTTWNIEELSGPGLQSQMGLDCVKNRTSGTSYQNSSKQASLNRHRDSRVSAKQGTTLQFVKKISLCGKAVHQINLDGRPYVFTDEIVNNFTHFNGRHVILKILEARKVEINFLELSRRRRPELFECLDKTDIACLNQGPTGNVIGSVHILPLRSVPYMLRALNRADEEVAVNVKEEMEKFDPSDPYWSGYID